MNTREEESEEGREGLCLMDFVSPVLGLDLLLSLLVSSAMKVTVIINRVYKGSCYEEIRFEVFTSSNDTTSSIFFRQTVRTR